MSGVIVFVVRLHAAPNSLWLAAKRPCVRALRRRCFVCLGEAPMQLGRYCIYFNMIPIILSELCGGSPSACSDGSDCVEGCAVFSFECAYHCNTPINRLNSIAILRVAFDMPWGEGTSSS